MFLQPHFFPLLSFTPSFHGVLINLNLQTESQRRRGGGGGRGRLYVPCPSLMKPLLLGFPQTHRSCPFGGLQSLAVL